MEYNLTLQTPMATFIQKIRKSRIQVTHKDCSSFRESLKSKERVEIRTPPKFKGAGGWDTAQASRYQTAAKNGNNKGGEFPASRATSLKRRELVIDTDGINMEHQAKDMRQQNQNILNDPLLACEDSVTILSRMQAKRREEKLTVQNKALSIEEDDFMINRSKDHFILSESKVAVFDSRVTTKESRYKTCEDSTETQEREQLDVMKRQLQELRKVMGKNNKISEIERLVEQLGEEMAGRKAVISQYSFKVTEKDENEIENLLMKQSTKWYSRSKESSVFEKKKVRIMNIQQEPGRVSSGGGLKSRCPLTEIVRYVNRKK